MSKLQHVLSSIIRNKWVLYSVFTALCIGVYYARAAVSVCTAMFAVVGIAALLLEGGGKRLREDRATLSLMAIFLIYLLSGINTANSEIWLQRLVTNAPFLAIPLGIHAMGPLDRRTLLHLMGIFIGVTCLAVVGVLIDYLQNIETYNALYNVGKTIPTPIIHVRFSFFVAIASLLSVGAVLDGLAQTKRARQLLWLAGLFLAFFLHLLAVRTGLLAWYGGTLLLVCVLAFRKKKWQILAGSLAGLALALFVAYQTMPSVQNKLGYMLWDLGKLTEEGVTPQYSDNVRIASIHHGLRLVSENPVFGVGIGDVEEEMETVYNRFTPEVPVERRFMPISQFVFWLVAFGIVGTIAIILLYGFPLIATRAISYMMLALYGATFFSCLAETTLQLQLGKTVFLLLLCVLLQHWRFEMVVQSVAAADDTAAHSTV